MCLSEHEGRREEQRKKETSNLNSSAYGTMTRSLDWELRDLDLRTKLPIICVFGQVILHPQTYLLRNCFSSNPQNSKFLIPIGS